MSVKQYIPTFGNDDDEETMEEEHSLTERFSSYVWSERFPVIVIIVAILSEAVEPFGFSPMESFLNIPIPLQEAIAGFVFLFILAFFFYGADKIVNLIHDPPIKPALEIENGIKARWNVWFAHQEYWEDDEFVAVGTELDELHESTAAGGIKGYIMRWFEPAKKRAGATWHAVPNPLEIAEELDKIHTVDTILDEELEEAREIQRGNEAFKLKAEKEASKKMNSRFDKERSDGDYDRLMEETHDEYDGVDTDVKGAKESTREQVESEQSADEGGDTDE